MAKLTPLSKGFLAVAIVVGTGSAGWHLGLKDVVHNTKMPTLSSLVATGPSEKPGASTPESGAGLGSAEHPLKVSIVSFHGYAPALVANGNSLKTQPGSLYDKLGINVEFVIQDDVPTLTTIFESKTAQCAWRTSDFWAQEQPNLRNAKLDARAILVVDNTQGGDAVIARDPSIKSIEDLAGKSVSLLQYTPSHGLLIDALNNSSLSAKKRQSIKTVFVNADEGTGGVRAAFSAGQVDAAVLWDPDLSLALKSTPGSHVVYSTKTATNLIYDIIVCDQRALASPNNDAVFGKFVDGWLQGVAASKASPDTAAEALVKNETVFAQLDKQEGRAFIKGLFANVVWTGLDDNVRILGLGGDTNNYERVYGQFDQIYRGLGALANPNSPVVNPQESFDYRFIKKLVQAKPEVVQAAAKPQFVFDAKDAAKFAASAPVAMTKPVFITFPSGSSALSKRAETLVDKEMVPLIESDGSAYFVVSGHTDATGAKAVNDKLSEARARALVAYLVKQWEFSPARFVIEGQGSDHPLCDEKKPETDGLTLEQCRESNRASRIAVLSR